MHGTVVHNPEDAASLVVGWSSHDLFDQTVEGRDTIDCFASAEHPGIMDIESTEVNPKPRYVYTGSRREPDDLVRWAQLDGDGAALECLSSRQHRSRIHRFLAAYPLGGYIGLRGAPPWQQTLDP